MDAGEKQLKVILADGQKARRALVTANKRIARQADAISRLQLDLFKALKAGKVLAEELEQREALQKIVHRRTMWLNKIWQKEDWKARKMTWCDLGKLIEWAWAKRCQHGNKALLEIDRVARITHLASLRPDERKRGGEGRE